MPWQTNTLGELCDLGGGKVKTGPFGSQLHQSDYQNSGTPVVMPTDISDGKIDITRIARVSDTNVERLHKHKLLIGDIIYGRRGDIGRQALVRKEYVGWLCGTGCLKVTLGDTCVLSEFLHLYLKMPRVIKWIQSQAIGATMPNLNTSILRRVPINYPDTKEEQAKIVGIVSAYNEIIDNNNQRISLLEQMDEEIYKEWFVRLRFPGHKETQIIDGVPDGWERQSFDDVAEYINGYAFKPEDWGDAGHPIIKIAELKNGVTENTPRNDGEKIPEKLHIKNGDILFSWSAHLDAYIWREGQGLLNQHLFKVVPNDEQAKWFLYFSLLAKMQHFRNLSNGATMQHIKRSELGRVFLLLPKNGLAEKFDSLVQSQIEEILILKEKIKILKQTRDLLLPRLMSGKLSVELLLKTEN